MIFALIFSIIETRSVQFPELATKLNGSAQDESNLRRIQAFFAHYELDYRVIACVLMSFVPTQKCRISIDRTNWQFGSQNINILTLTVYSHGVGLPILIQMLDKKGNSKAQERIDLLDEFVALFGKERILSLTGDREFIGHKWLKWLIDNHIGFAIRFPVSHLLTLRNGEVWRADTLLAQSEERYFNGVIVDGVRLNMALKQLANDYLLVGGSLSVKKLFAHYRHRWSIETFFQSLKKRGFRLEETHLSALDRLKKLIALASLAFVFCWQVGRYYHQNRSSIRLKAHGYKANSFFRKGLDLLRHTCKFIETRLILFEHYLSWLGKDLSIKST
ncbi:IS4 family transposase [Spirosoma litoris]